MFNNKPDLIQKEVDPPLNNFCSCGHISTGEYKRSPDSDPEPIRFFQVNGLEINGIYCEPCLVLIHYLARIKKGKKNEY